MRPPLRHRRLTEAARDLATARPLVAGAAGLWALVYVVFWARSAAMTLLLGRLDPLPLAHAMLRLTLCLFGFALSWIVQEALARIRDRHLALRLVTALLLTLAGAALYVCAHLSIYRIAYRSDASCVCALADFLPMIAMIFAAWTATCLVAGASRTPPALPRGGDRRADAALWVPSRNGRTRIAAEDILWIEAERECVRIHLAGQSHLVRDSLRGLAGRLDPAGFVRVHRSAIVRVSQIASVERGAFGLSVRLRSGIELPVGRKFAPSVRALARRCDG